MITTYLLSRKGREIIVTCNKNRLDEYLKEGYEVIENESDKHGKGIAT